jgi:threonine dehydrogenase-like Zn-dependent dehydrogenase
MLNHLHMSSVSSRFLLGAWRCQPYWNSKFYLYKYHGFVQSSDASACRSLSTAAPSAPVAESIPTDARVVIGGGGVIGCSVAYHLASAGWKNIVLLEQGRYALIFCTSCFY